MSLRGSTLRFLALIFTVIALFAGCKKNTVDGQADASGAGQNNPRLAADQSSEPSGDYGDMLIEVTVGEPLNLIPAIALDSASHDVASYIYNGLVTADKNLNIIGDLAESWEVSDDNLVLTFHLRNNVLWHDGKPFTSEDVLFTYEFMIDPNTPTAYGDSFKQIKSISAPDDYTVVVEYNEPYSPALLNWAIWIMPKHLLNGVQANRSSFQRNPIGTGPYKFESWPSNEMLTLKANPDYFDGEPYISRLMFRFVADQATAFMELLNESVDMMLLTPTQYAKQTDTDLFKSSYNKYEYLSRTYNFVGYNLLKAPFNDVRVRQALTYATPKNQMIDSVMQGLGIPTDGPYLPGSFWYNSDVKKYEYDLDKARALLADAGWIPNNSGMLVKDGKPFQITLITNQNNTRQQIAEILQKSWKELGIEVNIRVLEWGIFINEYIRKRSFDACILGWNIVLDPDPSSIWHSKYCVDNNELNFACFQNEEADQLMEAALLTYDTDERKTYYDKFQEILAEEQPYTFLFVSHATVAVSSRVKGIEPAPAGISYNYIKWYVPKNAQKYSLQE